MLILGINTVSDVCEAAVVEGGVIVADLSEPMMQGHDARLAPLVDRLMTGQGRSYAALDRIAVVVGPGSFTGVRVGVAFARGLSLALDAPAVGVTSLEALDSAPQDRRVLGLLPAKRRPPEKTWWAQVLDAGRGAFEPVEATESDIHRLATGVDAVYGAFAEIADPGQTWRSSKPTAGAAALFATRLRPGDLPAPRPVYVRAPDAKPMAQT
jgi:tRNA threonylcarbamoyladenosine biosynthesis protein TsaB